MPTHCHVKRRVGRRSATRRSASLLLRLHGDERGSMSLVAVFSLLLLTILLGSIINSARQVDSKIRLQNTADASTYSSGVVLARGMNSLAFTNHMLSDLFALTAFLREARDGHARSLTPEVLAAWERIAPVLAASDFPKFAALGQAIPEKVRLEREAIDSYSRWTSSIAQLVLPVFEELLAEEAIPQFQRAVVAGVPLQAQIAASEIAARHSVQVSARDANRGTMAAVLWRSSALPVGGLGETLRSSLPVVDPASEFAEANLIAAARTRRNSLAHAYLNAWNAEYMQPFDNEAKMSQFGRLWRGFTCGQLEKLLKVEYPNRNLPMMLRPLPAGVTADRIPRMVSNATLDNDYMFVGVAYWPRLIEAMPGMFPNPVEADNEAFAQGVLFVPTRRLVRSGVGRDPDIFLNHPWWNDVGRQRRPTQWDLWNQNWTFQLAPATLESIPIILSQDPSSVGLVTVPPNRYRPPAVGGLSGQQMQSISSH